mmetsp:Transcript_39090/g.103312  ORF Transcript_39090/g.103312 Transcript_39090/m.103312 type:complete len:82 (+) Transcript_39090:567-812(+)
MATEQPMQQRQAHFLPPRHLVPPTFRSSSWSKELLESSSEDVWSSKSTFRDLLAGIRTPSTRQAEEAGRGARVAEGRRPGT